jgi:hypothetical protein
MLLLDIDIFPLSKKAKAPEHALQSDLHAEMGSTAGSACNDSDMHAARASNARGC